MILVSFATSMSIYPHILRWLCLCERIPPMRTAPEESRTRARTTYWEHFQAQREDQVRRRLTLRIFFSQNSTMVNHHIWGCFFPTILSNSANGMVLVGTPGWWFPIPSSLFDERNWHLKLWLKEKTTEIEDQLVWSKQGMGTVLFDHVPSNTFQP